MLPFLAGEVLRLTLDEPSAMNAVGNRLHRGKLPAVSQEGRSSPQP